MGSVQASLIEICGERNPYPQAIGDSLLAFSELVLPPRFTLRAEQRRDAQYAILDLEVREGISEGERERLVQRIQNGIILSRYWEVRIGVVNLVVKLRPPGSIEHPFVYKHADLVVRRPAERMAGSTGRSPSASLEG